MTPLLAAAAEVAVRLPAYVSVAWYRPAEVWRLPRRVWRAFWLFYAIEARRTR